MCGNLYLITSEQGWLLFDFYHFSYVQCSFFHLSETVFLFLIIRILMSKNIGLTNSLKLMLKHKLMF